MVATEMQPLCKGEGIGGPGGNDGGSSGYSRPAPASRPSAPVATPVRQAPAAAKPASGFDDMDDDIPF